MKSKCGKRSACGSLLTRCMHAATPCPQPIASYRGVEVSGKSTAITAVSQVQRVNSLETMTLRNKTSPSPEKMRTQQKTAIGFFASHIPPPPSLVRRVYSRKLSRTKTVRLRKYAFTDYAGRQPLTQWKEKCVPRKKNRTSAPGPAQVNDRASHLGLPGQKG